MFRPLKMVKCCLAGERATLPGLLELLQELSLAHVIPRLRHPAGFGMSQPLEGASESAQLLVRLRAVMNALSVPTRPAAARLEEAEVRAGLRELLQKMERRVLAEAEKLAGLEGEREELERRLAELEPFVLLGLALEAYRPYRSLEYFLGTVAGAPRGVLEGFAERVERFEAQWRGKHYLALFARKEQAREISAALGKCGFSALRPPEGDEHPEKLAQALRARLEAASREIQTLKDSLETARAEMTLRLLAAEELLAREVERAEAPLRFSGTTHAYVIDLWVPERELGQLEEQLRRRFGERLYFAHQPPAAYLVHDHLPEAPAAGEPEKTPRPAENESPPVALDNPRPLRPFETLTHMFSTPRYDEIDPTPLLGLFFPLFFGLMVGDAAYGLLIAALGAYLWRKKESLKDLGYYFCWAGAAAFVSGTWLFGDMFGIPFHAHGQGYEWGWQWLPYAHGAPIHKLDTHGVTMFLTLSVFFGMSQMQIGYLVGALNRWRHSWKHGLAQVGWFLLLFMFGALVLNLGACRGEWLGTWLWSHTHLALLGNAKGAYVVAGAPLYLWVGLAGVGMLICAEGKTHLAEVLFELLGPFANMISYTRLAGVGVAKAALATALNGMILPMLQKGGLGLPAGVVLLVLAHLLVVVMGLLSGGVQGLRLNLFEFFSKFVTGGGTPYEPFGKARVYTRRWLETSAQA